MKTYDVKIDYRFVVEVVFSIKTEGYNLRSRLHGHLVRSGLEKSTGAYRGTIDHAQLVTLVRGIAENIDREGALLNSLEVLVDNKYILRFPTPSEAQAA